MIYLPEKSYLHEERSSKQGQEESDASFRELK